MEGGNQRIDEKQENDKLSLLGSEERIEKQQEKEGRGKEEEKKKKRKSTSAKNDTNNSNFEMQYMKSGRYRGQGIQRMRK